MGELGIDVPGLMSVLHSRTPSSSTSTMPISVMRSSGAVQPVVSRSTKARGCIYAFTNRVTVKWIPGLDTHSSHTPPSMATALIQRIFDRQRSASERGIAVNNFPAPFDGWTASGTAPQPFELKRDCSTLLGNNIHHANPIAACLGMRQSGLRSLNGCEGNNIPI